MTVALINGFVPQLGDTFKVLTAGTLSGRFSALILPSLSGDNRWDAWYSADSLTLGIVTPTQAGDYNHDGVVNLSDYDFWRSNFDSTNVAADGNGDGKVNSADYVVWHDHYLAAGTLMMAQVPEPATCSIAMLLIAPLLACRRILSRK